MQNQIELQNIKKMYRTDEGDVYALDGISLSVSEGEFVAIVGTSGSGKSTLMNMLGCLDLPTAGDYHLDGTDVFSLDDNHLSDIRNRKIGFVFQGFNLVQSLSAVENVELPLLYRRVPRATRRELAQDALLKVGLQSRLKHLPSQMSGGQQQRVAIARAIAARPPILLADEPTGNLDRQSGQEVMRILLDLHSEGKTIVLITHDMEVARMASRIIRIESGTISSSCT